MLERTERISFRISSVLLLSKVEPGARAGPSHRLRPKSTGSFLSGPGFATLVNGLCVPICVVTRFYKPKMYYKGIY